jgi:hypothetical protein
MLNGITDKIRSALTVFRRQENGTLSAEVVLALPVFIWCIFGMYTYWDAFKSLNTTQKASFTISDLITREMQPVTNQYLNGMHDVLQYMVSDKLPVEMRVTSVTFSGVRNRYEVQWSRSPYNERPALTTTSLQTLVDKIPMLADGDSIILVETWAEFTPFFDLYLTEDEFEQFIVTKPRFVPRICLDGVACG